LVTLGECFRDLAHHFDVEDVQWRAREGYAGDAIFSAELDVLVSRCHGLASQDNLVNPV
jgi:hypothetical protein